MKTFSAFIVLVALVSGELEAKSFKNHSVVTFTIKTEQQLEEIQSLEAHSGVKLCFKMQ
jgi:hypothetical protein